MAAVWRPIQRFGNVLRSLTLLVGCLYIGGCSYAVLMTVHPSHDGSSSLSDEQLGVALEGLSTVARQFGLVRSPQLPRFQQVWGEQGYRLVDLYGRAADAETHWSRIFLAAAIDKEGRFVVLLRAFESVEQNGFTQLLSESLAKTLVATLPDNRIEVRRIYDRPLSPK